MNVEERKFEKMIEKGENLSRLRRKLEIEKRIASRLRAMGYAERTETIPVPLSPQLQLQEYQRKNANQFSDNTQNQENDSKTMTLKKEKR